MSYLQHFILFVTYEWAQQPKVFVPGKTFQPSALKQTSLLGPFISYKENEVLLTWPLGRTRPCLIAKFPREHVLAKKGFIALVRARR